MFVSKKPNIFQFLQWQIQKNKKINQINLLFVNEKPGNGQKSKIPISIPQCVELQYLNTYWALYNQMCSTVECFINYYYYYHLITKGNIL